MTVRVYKSTDASAPVLSGTAGALVALLDAVLVNGYGSQPAAGWAKAFSGTNTAAYRAATGSRYYLMVDDSAVFVTAAFAKLRGYETMTDATDSGTNPFPSVAQATNGQTVNKSSTVSSTARPWVVIAHERAFYFMAASASSQTSYTLIGGSGLNQAFDMWFFGEIKSHKQTTDTYNCFLLTNLTNSLYQGSGSESTWGTTMNSHWMARNYNGAKISHACACQITGVVNGTTIMTADSTGFLGFPEFGTGEVGMVGIEVAEQSETSTSLVQWLIRGRLPGAYGSLTYFGSVINAGLESSGFIFNGTGAYAGRQFIGFTFYYTSSNGVAPLIIELTDNWYA